MKKIALALVLLAAFVAPVHAEDTFECEVVEIQASQADSASIDSSLKDLSKYLTKGPLAVYNKFVKLERTSKTLEVLKSETFATTKGSVSLMIREVRHPEGKKPVTNLQIGIDTEKGKRWLDAKQNVSLGKYGNYIRSVSSTEGIVYFVGCK
jgi:hypothetical protein